MKNNIKIIKVNPQNILPINEAWAATAGFSTSPDYGNPAFSYEIKPLSFTLCQKGNDPEMLNKNKSFKFFIGDHVSGYCPYDGKKHEGMIKYFYWVPGSDGTMPKFVYIQDFSNEDTIPLEADSIKQTLTRYTPNDLAVKDYYRARDTEIAHDYGASEMPKNVFEGKNFDFNETQFNFNSVKENLSLNEQYAYLNEARVMAKKFFEDNFDLKPAKGFSFKQYVDKSTDAYVTSEPSDGKSTGTMKFFAKHGISKVYNGSIGFSEKEQKWYGWSHRAIYGFGIGSKVKKGDCGYKGKAWTAKTLDDAKQMAKDFADAVS